MTIQQFIEKAIEGGWGLEAPNFTHYHSETWLGLAQWRFWETDGPLEIMRSTADILLDHSAWKAVGLPNGMVDMAIALSDGQTIEEHLATL